MRCVARPRRLARRGALTKRLRLYKRAVALQPSWTEGYWYLGTIYYDRDRHAECRDAFTRVVQRQPENGAAWAFRGLCEFRLKQYRAALDHLNRARQAGVGDDPVFDAIVAYHRAILFARFGQFERAFDVDVNLVRGGNTMPAMLDAIGIAMLRLPLLPDEVPPEQRDLVRLTGRAGVYADREDGRGGPESLRGAPDPLSRRARCAFPVRELPVCPGTSRRRARTVPDGDRPLAGPRAGPAAAGPGARQARRLRRGQALRDRGRAAGARQLRGSQGSRPDQAAGGRRGWSHRGARGRRQARAVEPERALSPRARLPARGTHRRRRTRAHRVPAPREAAADPARRRQRGVERRATGGDDSREEGSDPPQ